MRKLKGNDFKDIEPGTVLIVNTYDTICDVAVFLRFNKLTDKAVVCDSLLKSKDNKYSENICEYDEAFLFPIDKENLLHMLRK